MFFISVGAVEIKPGDIVQLRKIHPCGSYEWEVIRIGADIGIRCQKCQRQVLLERPVFEKRVKSVVSRRDQIQPPLLFKAGGVRGC